MSKNNIVHVAVAVIKNQHGQTFIAKRPANTHQGGLWEFPGGKLETNESVLDALKRELVEEVGITLIQASPLIRIHHDYDDRSVLLDVWNIDEYVGNAFGKEGQEVCWIDDNEFSSYNFPAANLPIIKAVQLPNKYLITGDFSDEDDFIKKLKSAIRNGIQLIQFRAHQLSNDDYMNYAKKTYDICVKGNIKLLLNTPLFVYEEYHANEFSDGIHLTSKELKLLSENSVAKNTLISASVHNSEELLFSHQLKIDFVVISPVNKTQSHPNSLPLGWNNFYQLTEKAKIPVFALGGMSEQDLNIARDNGAQGIAAISEFWKA